MLLAHTHTGSKQASKQASKQKRERSGRIIAWNGVAKIAKKKHDGFAHVFAGKKIYRRSLFLVFLALSRERERERERKREREKKRERERERERSSSITYAWKEVSQGQGFVCPF